MSELKIIATIQVKPDYLDEVKKILYSLADGSRKEEGNVSYDLHESIKDPSKLFIIEVWKSQEAINIHNNTKLFKDFIKFIDGKYDVLNIDVIKQIY